MCQYPGWRSGLCTGHPFMKVCGIMGIRLVIWSQSWFRSASPAVCKLLFGGCQTSKETFLTSCNFCEPFFPTANRSGLKSVYKCTGLIIPKSALQMSTSFNPKRSWKVTASIQPWERLHCVWYAPAILVPRPQLNRLASYESELTMACVLIKPGALSIRLVPVESPPRRSSHAIKTCCNITLMEHSGGGV